MATDIFIKTYPGDFEWLGYCIRSIEKFVTGFRKVVVVTDAGTELRLDSPLDIEIFYEPLPSGEHPCPVGIGYAWAQSVKLNWTRYTDAESVLQVDSDTMFCAPISLSSYWKGDKAKWFWREWHESGEGEVHRVPADFFIKRESVRDHMPAPTWLMRRKTTERLQKWAEEQWGGVWSYLGGHAKPLWSADPGIESPHMSTHRGWGSCEYHMYGNFAEFFFPDEHELVHLSEYSVPIRQSWSWGGLKEEEIRLREELLS